MWLLLAGLACQTPTTETASDSSVQETGTPTDSASSPSDTQAGTDSDPPPPPKEHHPNILMLSLDTIRASEIGRYSGLETTPFIDRLMDEGFTLEAHRSCSNWTYSAMVCALGAGHLMDLGFIPETDDDPESVIPYTTVPEDLVLFAERLAARDYQSALFSANGFVGGDFGTGRGYDTAEVRYSTSAEKLIEQGLEVFDETFDNERPWLFHIHFMDTHNPYNPPKEYLSPVRDLEPISWDFSRTDTLAEVEAVWHTLSEVEKELIRTHLDTRYRCALTYLNDQIESLFDALSARKAMDDTVVVLFSDHGEQFFEHGAAEHGNALYEEEGRTIGVFWGSGIEPYVEASLTSHRDLIPILYTLLEWDKTELPSWVSEEENDPDPIAHLLRWKEPGEGGGFSDTSREPLLAVVQGDKKLIYHWSGTREYYDLASDPDEQIELGASVGWDSLDQAIDDDAQRLYEEFFPEHPPG